MRSLAQAARRSGYRVHTIDCFADTDTASCAETHQQVSLSGHGPLQDDVLAAFKRCDPDRRHAVIIAGGFDHQPALLAHLQQTRIFLGISAQIHQLLCSPKRFGALLDQLDINYPRTTTTPSKALLTDNVIWLSKCAGGSGGSHVRFVTKSEECDVDRYWQQHIDGLSLSVTVLATDRQAFICGYTDQTPAATPTTTPFAFSQALALPKEQLSNRVRDIVDNVVHKLYESVPVRGLISLDFIVAGHQVWLLEVNPRPSATFALHDHDGLLLHKHVLALRGDDPQPTTSTSINHHAGFRIIYASQNLSIHETASWPGWVTDRPARGQTLSIGEPVCTVHAKAEDSLSLNTALNARCNQLLGSHLRPRNPSCL